MNKSLPMHGNGSASAGNLNMPTGTSGFAPAGGNGVYGARRLIESGSTSQLNHVRRINQSI